MRGHGDENGSRSENENLSENENQGESESGDESVDEVFTVGQKMTRYFGDILYTGEVNEIVSDKYVPYCLR